MADRTLVQYLEKRNEDGPYWTLEIQRSASGAPTLIFKIESRSFDGSNREEKTIVVEDADKVLGPAIDWCQQRRRSNDSHVVHEQTSSEKSEIIVQLLSDQYKRDKELDRLREVIANLETQNRRLQNKIERLER